MADPSVKRWPIIEDILKREGIARQHLNSFDEFFDIGLQSIIDETDHIDIENAEYPYKIQLGKVKIEKPRMMELDGSITHISPGEARLRNVSYAAPMYVEAKVVEDNKILESRFIHVGDIPVMIKSSKCILRNCSDKKLVEKGEDKNDPGGYFIINGSERVIVGLEDLSYNKIIVDKEILSGNIVYKAKVYSSIVGYRAKLELVMKNDGLIVARIPGSPVDIPVVTLMRALGLESDKDIASVVSLVDTIQDELEVSFEKSGDVSTSKDAIVYISKRIAPGMLEEFQIKRAETLLDWGLLPHLGKHPEHRKEKAQFLGEAACKLLELRLGWITPDDKDHYGNKVIKFAGQMLADLFRTAFKNLIRDMKYQLERSGQKRGINAVAAAIRPGIISDKLNNAIATGNWGRGRVGVTQLLDRTNYLSTISHLRRIQSPLSRTQPNFEARDLHSTHFGRICPSETPEGSNCGLVKNLALSGIISINVPSEDIVQKLYDMGVVHFFDAKDDLKRGTRVFVDGRLIGYVKDGADLANNMRIQRRSTKIHPHIGVSFQESSVDDATKRLYVNCNAGRVLRPLVVVENGKSRLSSELLEKVTKRIKNWTDLLQDGVLELIDANEEENCYITMNEDGATKQHTHLEVFPSAILGAGASIIPYPEHNQSPRNTYESAMAKQSLGFSTPMMNTSTYVRQHFMLYPQSPIVNTKAMKLLGLEDRPAGQNCVVAVLPFDGYNIEDAIVLNKASVDRGLGRTFFYRIYDAEAKQYPGGARDKFEIPSEDDNLRGYKGSRAYRLLEDDGVISTESTVKGGDILIAKSSPPRFMEEFRGEFGSSGEFRRDTSVGVRPSENGVVDTVVMTQSNEGGRMYKIRVRDMRIPEIGDKFASRHGQKGVLGILANAEDLPYTAQGMSPDVLINPHAFPSRMTVGMMMESICGKAAALRGKRFDGSAFVGEKMDEVKEVMDAHGFKYSGKEIMYDGRTGQAFPVDVFMGVVYYQKLHHMVSDKIHARARGQVQMLTKQPTEGRARGGGLRFGEMERDCLIAYGASMILKDRLLDESDKSDVFVCERCGLVAYYDARHRKYVCRVCGDKAKVSSVSVAYAFKLLLQEMQSLNVAPRLLIKERV